MPVYQAPVRDSMFLLNEVFGWDRYSNLPGFSDAPPDVVEAMLIEGAKLCEEVLQPLNHSGDLEGCTRHPDGTVTTPKGFNDAYKAYSEGGWIGLAANPDHGGQGLPYTLAGIINEYSASANMAFTMYPGLTQSAIAAIEEHASDELKALYLPKMISGEWSGTMNLTEPHCGTDLGLLKTKAIPNGDGTYAISGQKIFISAGEHDLSGNIVHLVLARIEGAPEGTKGISLFVVPKHIPGDSGLASEINGVSCGAIEHKMGIHANSTCVMNYDGAKGWLIGEENRGLNAMFVMMNEARLGVANQGLAQSEAAYQNAVQYAKERLQGRALSGPKQPEKPADPLLVHPDVRRMLMEIRAFNESARAFMMYASLKADLARRSPDEKQREEADDILGLLTPVLKGVLTDKGFENAVKAQQVFGGHGYIKEWGMEQFVRDARIAMIYEGANGIQALDLVGRKLARKGGKTVTAFFNEVAASVKDCSADEALKPYAEPVGAALGDLQKATMWFMQNAMAKPDNAGAGSTDYMHLMGLVAQGYMLLLIAKAALAKKASDADAAVWMDAKILTAKFFMERILPESAAHLARISSGADTMMAMPEEAF